MPKLLITEDDPTDAFFACRAATKHGFKPIVARDGIQALHLIEEHQGQFAGVLVDFDLPCINGSEVIRLIKERYPHLTAVINSSRNKDEISCPEADGIHSKPIHPHVFAHFQAKLLPKP